MRNIEERVLTRVEKWFAFIKKNLKSEEIICSIELEEIDHMAIFLASALHGKKWVSLNTRLSKNDILLQLQQIPISVYVSNKDLALPGYRALICDEHIDPTSINYTIDSSKDCLLVFTSGSSGTPKAVVHSFSSLIASAEATNKFYGICKSDVWLLSLGLFHIAGIMIFMRMLLKMAAIELLDDSLSEKINEKRSNIVSLVPTQIARLIESNTDLSHLKLLIVGGAKAEDWLIKRFIELSLPVSISYGSSETCAQISATRILNFDGSCGEILDNREVIISKSSNLMVKGQALFSGYYVNKKFIDPKIFGYFETSDIAEIVDGRLFVKGRSDRVFHLEGKYIPEIIERNFKSFEVRFTDYSKTRQGVW